MEIHLCADVVSREWEALVASDPHATFFHRTEWARVVEGAIAGWSRSYVVATRAGRMVAALPFMARRSRGAVAVASMPFGTYGGILTDRSAPSHVADALFEHFARFVRAPRIAYAELVDFPSRLTLQQPPSRMTASEREAYVLDLTPGVDTLMRGFAGSNRNKIHRARRHGVRVRRATSVDDYLAYHSMYVDCCARWQIRPRLKRRFFTELWKLGPSHVDMWIAEFGEDPVAALLNMTQGSAVVSWGNVSVLEGRRHGANNLLHAVAIEDAVSRGATVYSFGANPGLPGVHAFKQSFSVRPHRYTVYRNEKSWYRVARRIRAR